MFESTVYLFMNFGDERTREHRAKEGDSPHCPVVKWDGNDGEPFSAEVGADQCFPAVGK